MRPRCPTKPRRRRYRRVSHRPMWLLLALACTDRLHVPPSPLPAGVSATAEAAVDFSSLEHRVSAMLAESQDVDQRDRLAELRDLMADMRTRDPSAQRRVFVYVKRALAIEERTRPERIAPESFAPLTEETLEVPTLPASSSPGPAPTTKPAPLPNAGPTPAATAPAPVVTSSVPPPPPVVVDPLVRARRALGEAKYLDAIAALEGVDLGPTAAPDLARVRKEAVDGWARTERERAGSDFLTARARPPGEERSAALLAVRDRLAAINARFPENSYAADIARNVALVEQALSAAPGSTNGRSGSGGGTP